MSSNRGFTLIELVVVIVILGILSVTAAPRFLNLQSDARKATLDSFAGSLAAANELVMLKAVTSGVADDEGPLVVPGTDIQIRFGALVLTADNVENAMMIHGYRLHDLKVAQSNRVMVYLGKEKTLAQAYRAKCFLQFSKDFTAVDGSDEISDMSGINVIKVYQGC